MRPHCSVLMIVAGALMLLAISDCSSVHTPPTAKAQAASPPFDETRFTRIRHGMNRADVMHIMGAPDRRTWESDYKEWIYIEKRSKYERAEIDVLFRHKRVAAVGVHVTTKKRQYDVIR